MSNIFDKMKEKSKGTKLPPTNAQDVIDEVKEELVKEQLQKTKTTFPPPESRPPPPEPMKRSARKDTKIQKEVTNLKKDILEIRSLVAELTREIATNTPSTPQNRKLKYEEFVEHMLSKREVGTHYKTYVDQYTGETTGHGKPKKSNFNHIYMIYLDLP